MSIYAESARLRLRPLADGDAPLLLDLDSDPQVMRHLSDGKASTPEEVQAALGRIKASLARSQGRFGVFAAHLKSGGDFIGWFLLRPDAKAPENEREVELGYRLKRAYWGQGYASEMSLVLLEKAWSLGVEEVFATTMLANLGSQNVMKKIGMTFERHFTEERFPGEDKRAVRYALTAPGLS